MKPLILFLALIITNAFASEEEIAFLTSFEATTTEILNHGSVSVRAKTDNGRIARLMINAFGKEYTLADENLKKISSFPLSSIEITHGPGYERLGGYTVHIKLRRTYINSEKKVRDETASILVTEMKGLMAVDIRDAN